LAFNHALASTDADSVNIYEEDVVMSEASEDNSESGIEDTVMTSETDITFPETVDEQWEYNYNSPINPALSPIIPQNPSTTTITDTQQPSGFAMADSPGGFCNAMFLEPVPNVGYVPNEKEAACEPDAEEEGLKGSIEEDDGLFGDGKGLEGFDELLDE
jgi:hypothetical protein